MYRTKHSLNQEKKKYGVKPTSLIGTGGHYVKTLMVNSVLLDIPDESKDDLSCMIIDCGQGGDFLKYLDMGVLRFFMTDPFQDQLDRCKETIKKSDITTQSYILKKLAFLDSRYVNQATDFQITYDIIDWQFAIHYSWNQQTNKDIASKLSTLMHLGSIFTVSFFDGKKLRDELREKKVLSYQLTQDSGFTFSYINENKYLFSNSSNPVEENYVFIEDLVAELSKYNIKHTGTVNFGNILSNIESTPKIMFDGHSVKLFQICKTILEKNFNSNTFREMLQYYKYMNGLEFIAE